MEPAAFRADSEDRGRERLAARVQPESLLDRVDALRKREEFGDLAPPEEQRLEDGGAGGQELFSAGPELLPGSSPISPNRWAPSESRPIGPTYFSAVTVIRLT